MRPEPLLTAQGVAQLFGVPVSWVYAKAEAGELPCHLQMVDLDDTEIPASVKNLLHPCPTLVGIALGTAVRQN